LREASESLKDKQTALGESALPPTSGNEAKSRIARPNVWRTNFGVVPLIRPSAISDGVSLADKLGREMRAFVAEERAFNAFLRRDRVVDVFSPDKDSISCVGSENDMLSGADELAGVKIGAGIVPPIHGKA